MTNNELRTLEELLNKAEATGYFNTGLSEVWDMVKGNPQTALKWYLGYISADTGTCWEED